MTDTIRVSRLIKAEAWGKLAALARRRLHKLPASEGHWWSIQLGMSLSALGRYAEASAALDAADKVKSHCPYVRWYRAEVAYRTKNYRTAADILTRLYTSGRHIVVTYEMLKGGCWENLTKAEAFTNDCRAMLGECYNRLGRPRRAVWWLVEHLRYRRRGLFSVYSAAYVRRLCNRIAKTAMSRGATDE